MLSKNLKKITLTMAGIAIATVSMSAQADIFSSSKKSNYKIKDEKLAMITNMEMQILEASKAIQAQLELLNDTRDVIQQENSNGIQAKYKVPSNQNIKDINVDDIELMSKEGRTNNNPSLKHDMVYNGRIDGELSEEDYKNFYKTPVEENKIQSSKFVDDVQNTYGQIGSDRYIKVNNDGKIVDHKNMDRKVSAPATKSSTPTNSNINKPVQNNINTENELDRLVKLNGEYEITEIIGALASGANYEFVLIGENKKYSMKIGNENESFNGTIKEALISIGQAVGSKALINVDTKDKIIKMEYK